MANQTGSFSNIADLMAKLSTFATTNGWTQDYTASDRLFLTNGTVSVAFRWATSSPTYVAMYQHTAFLNSSTDPGNHTNDSGTGQISSVDSTLDDGRGFNCDDTNGGTYWFFEDATYIHCVIEYEADWFEHFGFGILEKTGTWTGGEYCYGQYVNGKSSSVTPTPSGNYSCWLDGLTSVSSSVTVKWAATMRAEGLPGQGGSEKWVVIGKGDLTTSVTDRGSNTRRTVQGGFQTGPDANNFSRFDGQTTSGLIPLYKNKCWYKEPSTTDWYPLGEMKDVAHIQCKYFAGGDEITIGSDTWVVFPQRTRYADYPLGSSTGTTGYKGVAYKKVS